MGLYRMACERISEARLVLRKMSCLTATLQIFNILLPFVKYSFFIKTMCSHFAYSKKEHLQVSQDKPRKHYSE